MKNTKSLKTIFLIFHILLILSLLSLFTVKCYAESPDELEPYRFHRLLDRVVKTASKYNVYNNETADSFISIENGIYFIYVPNKSMKNYLDKVFGSYEYVQYTYDPPQRVENTSKKRYIDFKDGKKEYINGWYTGNSGNPGLYENGWRLTGWQEYDGEKYFMFENGGYATGLYQIGDDLHFFSDNGKYIKTCNIKDYKGTNENLRKDALRRLDRYARDSCGKFIASYGGRTKIPGSLYIYYVNDDSLDRYREVIGDCEGVFYIKTDSSANDMAELENYLNTNFKYLASNYGLDSTEVKPCTFIEIHVWPNDPSGLEKHLSKLGFSRSAYILYHSYNIL